MADLFAKYGVDRKSIPQVQIGKGASPVKQSQPDGFFQNLGNSAKNLGMQGLQGLGQAVISPITDTIKGVTKLQQGIYDNYNFNQGQADLGRIRASNDALRKNTASALKAGKITKERANKILKGLSDTEAKQIDQSNNVMGVKDYVESYGQSMAAPLALGSLGLGAGKGKAAEIVGEQFGAGKSLGSNALTGLAGKGLRNALVTQPTIQSLGTIAGGLDPTSNKMDVAKEAALLASPALLTAGGAILKGAGKAVNKALYDSQGLFDMVKIKDGTTINQAFKALSNSDPSKATRVDKVLRQVQDYNLRAFKGDKQGAADFLTEYIGKKNLKNISLDDFVKEQKRFINADKVLGKAATKLKEGETLVAANGVEILPGSIGKLGAVKSTQQEVSGLIKALKDSRSPVEAAKAAEQFALKNPRFRTNQQNQRIMEDIINAGKFGDEAASMAKGKLVGTNQVFIKTAEGELKPVKAAGGYYLGERGGTTRFQGGNLDPLEQGNKAIFGGIGKALRKTGLSTEEQVGQARTYQIIKDTFASKVPTLEGRNGSISGEAIFKKLEDASSRPGVTDIRQLTAKEVEKVLGTSLNDARLIRREINNSFLSIPTSERGIASKIQDINLAKNPLAAPYSRAQGLARYEKNPFFRLQENIETKLGVAAATGKRAKFGEDYTKSINTLKNNGILTAGYANEGAGEGISRISAKLSRYQERTMAAGFESLASKNGESLEKFITNPKNADLIDNMKTIVQYPEKGLTSSNFMKALNLATFPARYNIKVTQFAYKAMRSRPGIEQVAIIKGLSDYHSFLESKEGIKWQSDNSEALGLLHYFTPIGSIESVMRQLSGKATTVRDFGAIGGLPFGVISAVAQGQGIINLDSPFVDPKTGEVVPNKIPKDLKARAEQALNDIVGTLYTFPGRLAGVESKKKVSGKVVDIATFGQLKGGDYESVTRTDTTPEQKRKQDILKVYRGTTDKPQNTTTAKPSISGAFKQSTITVPQRRTVVPKASKGKAPKKKAVRIGQPF